MAGGWFHSQRLTRELALENIAMKRLVVEAMIASMRHAVFEHHAEAEADILEAVGKTMVAQIDKQVLDSLVEASGKA